MSRGKCEKRWWAVPDTSPRLAGVGSAYHPSPDGSGAFRPRRPRHSREGGNPVRPNTDPAFAGVTTAFIGSGGLKGFLSTRLKARPAGRSETRRLPPPPAISRCIRAMDCPGRDVAGCGAWYSRAAFTHAHREESLNVGSGGYKARLSLTSSQIQGTSGGPGPSPPIPLGEEEWEMKSRGANHEGAADSYYRRNRLQASLWVASSTD